jgi:serine protease Do
MAPLLGVQSGKGMWVISVAVGSTAESAGIKQGDIILSVNGTEVNDSDAFLRAIAAAPSGQPIPIVLWSAKVQRQVSVRF